MQNAKKENNVLRDYISTNMLTKSKYKKNYRKKNSEYAAKKYETCKIKSTQKKILKLIKFYFLNNTNFEAWVNSKDVKKIFKKIDF